jgi:hypothetical protein
MRNIVSDSENKYGNLHQGKHVWIVEATEVEEHAQKTELAHVRPLLHPLTPVRIQCR